jgi:serine/threonine-protein kinase RsbW
MTSEGPPEAPQLRLSGLCRRADLAMAQQRLQAFLSSQAVTARALYACELVLEECLANLFEHAQPAVPGQGVQGEVHVELAGDEIVMRFRDDASAFDPTARAAPTLPTSLDDARPGGLGLMLVRRWSRRLQYTRGADGNLLTVVIGNQPGAAGSAQQGPAPP